MSVEAQREISRGRARHRPLPHSRVHSLLTNMDWSSPEGRIIVAARAELTAHVGGNSNNVQKR